MIDTGLNIPETIETLLEQQKQLIAGRRVAQMFPLNSSELVVPTGFSRVETSRGVFHFDPTKISRDTIWVLSETQHENTILGLGPYNKKLILDLHAAGESILTITERTASGVEVKAAIGTQSTAPKQIEYFELFKTPGNIVSVETVQDVLTHRRMAC